MQTVFVRCGVKLALSEWYLTFTLSRRTELNLRYLITSLATQDCLKNLIDFSVSFLL
jgi:hypothetical protein